MGKVNLPYIEKIPAPPKGASRNYLKIDELELNKIYTCRLSGNKVMIVSMEQSKLFNCQKSIIGIYFNKVKGEYTIVDVMDYMLYE